MSKRRKMIEVISAYAPKIKGAFDFYVGDDIPQKQIENAIDYFAFGLNPNKVIGFLDTTIFGNGKKGYLFTDEKIYYKETLGKPGVIYYDNISSFTIIESDDNSTALEMNVSQGLSVKWSGNEFDKTLMSELIESLLRINNPYKYYETTYVEGASSNKAIDELFNNVSELINTLDSLSNNTSSDSTTVSASPAPVEKTVPLSPPPIPQATVYHVAANGQATGPFDINTLQQMVNAGQLSTTSMVWKAGMPEWDQAGNMDDLKNLFTPSMPPIPME